MQMYVGSVLVVFGAVNVIVGFAPIFFDQIPLSDKLLHEPRRLTVIFT
jgi:hypothetical protein